MKDNDTSITLEVEWTPEMQTFFEQVRGPVVDYLCLQCRTFGLTYYYTERMIRCENCDYSAPFGSIGEVRHELHK